MTLLLDRDLERGDSVAIVDDRDQDAATTAELLLDAGFLPVRVPLADDLTELLLGLKSTASAAVCDHRLSQYKSVPYDGAEVAARCQEMGMPSVLLTTWANSDVPASIRRWRHDIPRVLQRGLGSSPELITEALRISQKETRGHYSSDRQSYRTVVRVTRVDKGQDSLVEAIVTAWRPTEAVQLPASLISNDTGLSAKSLAGRRFLADVNIYAGDQADLYFRNFAVLEEPPDDWMTA